jgi:hypothetical protein
MLFSKRFIIFFRLFGAYISTNLLMVRAMTKNCAPKNVRLSCVGETNFEQICIFKAHYQQKISYLLQCFFRSDGKNQRYCTSKHAPK